MKNIPFKSLILVGLILAALGSAISAWSTGGHAIQPQPAIQDVSPIATTSSPLFVTGKLTQSKVYFGGDGRTSLALTLTAGPSDQAEDAGLHNIDLVIVLDRSGSMEGDKIADAKAAIIDLFGKLTPHDRLALISYSTDLTIHSELLTANEANIRFLREAMQQVRANGRTNLGAGLAAGLEMLKRASQIGNQGRVILISDGLANEGITDHNSLAAMAATGLKNEFVVTTVGLGQDFNEQLMTAIADRGAGTYYYLDDPASFASIFATEFHQAKMVVASSIEVRIPLPEGVVIIDAAGYPIEKSATSALFYPGDLLAGQTRKLYITFRVPTASVGRYLLSGITVTFGHENRRKAVTLPRDLTIACVKDREAVFASYDKDEFSQKIIQEDYSRLRDEVAQDIRLGKRQEALERINAYKSQQSEINAILGSDEVQNNLEKDLTALKDTVADTFIGSTVEVEQKQKTNAKAMQYESYGIRRSK